MPFFPLVTSYSVPPSKFKDIKGQLHSLHEGQGKPQRDDNFQRSERVYEVLECLQEAIDNYQVRSLL